MAWDWTWWWTDPQPRLWFGTPWLATVDAMRVVVLLVGLVFVFLAMMAIFWVRTPPQRALLIANVLWTVLGMGMTGARFGLPPSPFFVVTLIASGFAMWGIYYYVRGRYPFPFPPAPPPGAGRIRGGTP